MRTRVPIRFPSHQDEVLGLSITVRYGSDVLDTTALRMVRAIAETGSFSGAARELGYSQPAVSQHIRRLERRVGTPLVVRSGRAVRLTEAGAALSRHAGSLLATLAAAEEEVAAIAGLRTGRVRLVAFPSSSASLVPHALAQLRQSHPGISVSFSEAEPPESLALVRGGECDVAVAFSYAGTDLGRGEDDLEGLVAVPLLSDPLRVALPSGHQAAAASVVSLSSLADETWIAGCPRCRGHLLAACESVGFTPTVAFATDDYVAVQGLIASGLGVALISEMILESVHHPGIVSRPVEPASTREVSAVTTPDLLRVPAVRTCIDALTAVSGDPSQRSDHVMHRRR
jgi:molybdate transport repressor ModE-like protein